MDDEYMNQEDLELLGDLDYRTIALVFLIIASLISIYISNSEKQELLKIIEVDEEQLEKLQLITSVIILAVTIYFLYANYKVYVKDPNQINRSYLFAATLAFLAALINTFTLINELRNPDVDSPDVDTSIPITGF